MRTSALFGAKNIEFFKIYGVSARTRGAVPVRTFFGQGGINFLQFCADVLYGCPLITIHVCIVQSHKYSYINKVLLTTAGALLILDCKT